MQVNFPLLKVTLRSVRTGFELELLSVSFDCGENGIQDAEKFLKTIEIFPSS
jgi:hypothetical protein